MLYEKKHLNSNFSNWKAFPGKSIKAVIIVHKHLNSFFQNIQTFREIFSEKSTTNSLGVPSRVFYTVCLRNSCQCHSRCSSKNSIRYLSRNLSRGSSKTLPLGKITHINRLYRFLQIFLQENFSWDLFRISSQIFLYPHHKFQERFF